jgi:hypothetical protein
MSAMGPNNMSNAVPEATCSDAGHRMRNADGLEAVCRKAADDCVELAEGMVDAANAAV